MFDDFIRYKKDHHGRLKLVLIGKAFMKVPEHPDIINLGFVSDEDKFDALRASKLLVMPSLYESLSMALLEAWLAERPVLVNKRCDVLRGQCEKSKGGLTYDNYDEFALSLNTLLSNEALSAELGKQGRKFVDANYSWKSIEEKYLSILNRLS
jgi:glycosyltransferase involved in cell wall biosynthesis